MANQAPDIFGSEDAGHRWDSLQLKRHRSPVERVGIDDARPTFVVYRYPDVARVLNDASQFSTEVVGDRYGPVFGGSTVLSLEGAAHRQMRGTLTKEFRPASLAERVRDSIFPVVQECVDRLARTPGPDFVRDVAWAVPAHVISKILGFEPGAPEAIAQLVDEMFCFAENPRAGMRAARTMRRLCQREIANRRDDVSRNDLTATLMATDVGGRTLGDTELVATLTLLIGAGTKTTADALSTIAYLALDREHPVKSGEPSSPRAFIEESLRWESPAQVLARSTLEDTELAGVRVPAGSLLLLHIGSANRDETVFEGAEQFEPERGLSQPHLAFGWGEHRCLGLHLARLEAELVLETIIDKFANVTINRHVGRPRIEGNLFRSVRELPLALH
jgi:cytochrome P450